MLSKGLVNIGGYIHVRKTIDGRRVQKSLKIPYKRDYFDLANRMLRDLENTIYEGKTTRKPRTCKEGVERYLQNRPAKSVQREIVGLSNILSFRLSNRKLIEDIYLHDVRYWMIAEFIEHRLSLGKWARGISTDIVPFRRIQKFAATIWHDDNGDTWIDKPATLPSAQGPGKSPYILSRADERRFIPLLPRTIQPMALFGIHTGCRSGEICGLKWTHYRERDGIAFFSLPATLTKKGRERVVVLDRAGKIIVEKQRGGEFVFDVRSMNAAGWKRAWEAARLPPAADVMKGPHNLRYTAAFRWRDAGSPKWVIALLLGHGAVDVTELYAKGSLKAMYEAVNAPYVVGSWLDARGDDPKPLIQEAIISTL